MHRIFTKQYEMLAICLTLCACGCGDHHPSSEFNTSAFALREDYGYWRSHGRPADFQPSQVAGNANEFFVYTNVFKTTNAVFHCRFGSRRPGWPPGVLAITDEGEVIFVCSTNGKVTISPDEYGVDP
jgi:hypothetical protein